MVRRNPSCAMCPTTLNDAQEALRTGGQAVQADVQPSSRVVLSASPFRLSGSFIGKVGGSGERWGVQSVCDFEKPRNHTEITVGESVPC